jgi:hypothetical protein
MTQQTGVILTTTPKYPIVEVIWIDAEEAGDLGWNDPDEMIAESGKDCPLVRSVGYVVFESDSHISLVRSWHLDGFSSVEKIPKGFIRSIKGLGELL